MDQLTARPNLLKQVNITSIRNTLKTLGTATRAEIAAETGISSTTVRLLLTEMLLNKEIESIGYDESSGGRKAERYQIQPDRYHGIAFCISGRELHAVLTNICGDILRIYPLEVTDDNYEQAILPFLDPFIQNYEIRAIGIGVPGIVENESYWKKSPNDGVLYQEHIGTTLAARYQLPVILENDLNATAIGFGQCYEKDFPNKGGEQTNMAYVHFDSGCISAGFISGGRIIRGCKNFAGELGLVPFHEESLLDAALNSSMDDLHYTKAITQVLSWICGILNPQYIALGGPDFRKNCLGSIGDLLSSLLPEPMAAEILYAPDVWSDYYHGMAYLTAGKMFQDIQLPEV